MDAIEGQHGWVAALGYARQVGLHNTSDAAMARLGRQAAKIARIAGIEPEPVPHRHYGTVNSFPPEIWQQAADELGLLEWVEQ